MKLEELKRAYGNEYPAAINIDGKRFPLSRETRFSRTYHPADRKTCREISRFMDSSASITLAQLKSEWSGWTEAERIDFCEACGWLNEQQDFPDMLRFILQNGDLENWSAIALSVGSHLPQDEAFNTLVQILRGAGAGTKSNIAQAIAKTKHAGASDVLRKHLDSVWTHSSLWDAADFINWVAFDATTCIAHLIEIGVSPAEFDERVRRLSRHVCSGNQNSCRNFLSKHYSWLKGASATPI